MPKQSKDTRLSIDTYTFSSSEHVVLVLTTVDGLIFAVGTAFSSEGSLCMYLANSGILLEKKTDTCDNALRSRVHMYSVRYICTGLSTTITVSYCMPDSHGGMRGRGCRLRHLDWQYCSQTQIN